MGRGKGLSLDVESNIWIILFVNFSTLYNIVGGLNSENNEFISLFKKSLGHWTIS